MAERPRTKPLTPEEIMALPDGARVVIWMEESPGAPAGYYCGGTEPVNGYYVRTGKMQRAERFFREAAVREIWEMQAKGFEVHGEVLGRAPLPTKPFDIEAACAGHLAAERQLRALRAVERWARSEAWGHRGNCLCDVCTAFEELDAADAAVKGER